MEKDDYLRWINDDGILTIPNNIISIPSDVFRDNQTIKSIRCGNFCSLKSIGDYTFANCVNITTIDFPERLQTIGKNAFDRCSSLQSIVIHKRIKMIDSYAFKDCINLIDVELEPIKTRDYNAMLQENEQFVQKFSQKLMSPSPVEIQRALMQSTISDGAFQNCQSLVSIHIPNHFKKIGDYAFRGCSNLQIVDLGWMSIEAVIGLDSFMNCSPTIKYYFRHRKQKAKLLAMNQGIKSRQVIRRMFFGKHFKIHPGLFILLVNLVCLLIGLLPLFLYLTHKL